MTTVIHAEGLGKRYRRPPAEGRSAYAPSLRELFTQTLHSPMKMLRRPKQEMFWALRDVSLEVKEGEVLGLIGRNGAGKTTLLKLLARIMRPTEGWGEIRGPANGYTRKLAPVRAMQRQWKILLEREEFAVAAPGRLRFFRYLVRCYRNQFPLMTWQLRVINACNAVGSLVVGYRNFWRLDEERENVTRAVRGLLRGGN